MPGLLDIDRLANPDGGLILEVSYDERPLWFSDIKVVAVSMNKCSIAVRGVMSERRLRSAPALSRVWFHSNDTVTGSGVSYERSEALCKAVSEGLERLCGQTHDLRRFMCIEASHRELESTHRMLPLERYHILTEHQYDALMATLGQRARERRTTVVRLQEDARIRWVECSEIDSGDGVLVPLAVACFGSSVRPNEVVCEQVSTGLACHETLEEAMVAGLCEVIERDAIMGMWLARLSAPRVDIESCHAAGSRVCQMIDEIGRIAGTLYVNDITSDLAIPVFFATILSPQPPYAVVGAGCHPNASRALEKALLEVFQGFVSYSRAMSNGGRAELFRTTDEGIRDMTGHGRHYAFQDLRDRFEFLWRGPRISFEDSACPEEAEVLLPVVLSRIRACGLNALFTDLTMSEVAKLGLRVVRAIVPGMLPLNCLPEHAALGSPRLAAYEGLWQRSCGSDERANPWPHPFP